MGQNRRLFYGTWIIAWPTLACITSIVFSYLPGSNSRIFNPEAWFAAFPVAWTVALLVVRYQESIRAFLFLPLVRRSLFLAFFSLRAWKWWESAVRHNDPFWKAVSILLPFAALYLIFIDVQYTRKAAGKRPNL